MKRKVATRQSTRNATPAKKVAQARKIAARRRREAIPPDEQPLDFIETRPSPLEADQVDSSEVTEFSKAMERYKRAYGRPFPAWSEVLHVLKELGYRKVSPGS